MQGNEEADCARERTRDESAALARHLTSGANLAKGTRRPAISSSWCAARGACATWPWDRFPYHCLHDNCYKPYNDNRALQR